MGWKGLEIEMPVGMIFKRMFCHKCGARLKKEKITKITFTTKAEDKCLSVAASSIISRYIFIKEFSKLGDTVNTFLKKGAGHEVDEIGVKIVQKYGFNKLKDIAKLNFKNTDKIKELLNNK